MENSLENLLNFRLMVPLEADKSFVMAARLELFITSTMVKLVSGVVFSCCCCCCKLAEACELKLGPESEELNELEVMLDVVVALAC